MTLKDKATIQRALGMVEGIAAGEVEAKASILRDAISMIESVLQRDGTRAGGHEKRGEESCNG